MKYSLLLACGLALTLPLSAGPKKADAQATPNSHSGKVFKKTDKDSDGFLSKEEFLARAAKIFSRKDKDSDGKLSPAECAGKNNKSAKQGKGQKKNQGAKPGKGQKKNQGAKPGKGEKKNKAGKQGKGGKKGKTDTQVQPVQ